MKWRKTKSVVAFIVAMLFALSMLYIVFWKAKILFNLK